VASQLAASRVVLNAIVSLCGSVVVKHYGTSRKVADSRPDEVNDFFFNFPNHSLRTRPGVYSASNKNEYQKQKNNVSRE
jgi:hypothetical protein